MARGGGNKTRYQYCTDSSGIILYLRALQKWCFSRPGKIYESFLLQMFGTGLTHRRETLSHSEQQTYPSGTPRQTHITSGLVPTCGAPFARNGLSRHRRTVLTATSESTTKVLSEPQHQLINARTVTTVIDFPSWAVFSSVRRHQKHLQDGSSSCQCSTTSHGDQETMKKNASQMLDSFLYIQRDLERDNGHFLVLVHRKVVFYQCR